MRVAVSLTLTTAVLALAACSDDGPNNNSDGETSTSSATEDTGETGGDGDGDFEELDTFGFANGCYSIESDDGWLTASTSGDSYSFAADQGQAARFTMRPADLGTYLFYDEDRGYLVSDDGPLLRQTSLQSDMLLNDDSYVSGAEWVLQTSPIDPTRYQLHNIRNDELMTATGLGGEGLPVSFVPADGCVEYPELTLDASGTITKTTWDDGDLYGVVDTHSHIMSNYAFGGGSIFHGAAFHRLGVEHALPDCEPFHGEMGKKDFFGWAFDQSGADFGDLGALLPAIVAGELEDDNHITTGYPDFTDWPAAPRRSTHQVQYYKWLERAYLSGLRLVVQHATTNSVICDFTVGQGAQESRYSCNDMVAVDRIIEETKNMERYIDALAGGPGEGWFRIIDNPADAREVIAEGKMAVLLGIETANLFDCFSVEKEGKQLCTEAEVIEKLDAYHAKGIRAMFPVHKYDNAFTPGDGDRSFIELGNFLNSGHWSNFTLDCPDGLDNRGFDNGDVNFGGLNMPRDEYISPPPNDMSGFPDAPFQTLSLFLSEITAPPLVGPYCQNASITPLGETLLEQMMLRGMIIEVDHFPQWSYVRAYEILEAADYPASGSHGRNYNGKIYELGGTSSTGFGRCRTGEPGSTVQGFLDKIAFIEQHGGYPAEGFSFDLNGFASARGPRFGDGNCAEPQTDPVTYPFTSHAGDVTFTEPVVGNRVLDFNNEGLVHIGLLPELIEDARNDAVDPSDLDPLFHSAEAYIRMWEKAEMRAGELRKQAGLAPRG